MIKYKIKMTSTMGNLELIFHKFIMHVCTILYIEYLILFACVRWIGHNKIKKKNDDHDTEWKVLVCVMYSPLFLLYPQIDMFTCAYWQQSATGSSAQILVFSNRMQQKAHSLAHRTHRINTHSQCIHWLHGHETTVKKIEIFVFHSI